MSSFKCIDSLEENPTEVFLQVTGIILKLIDNVLLYPSDPKYRKLRLANKLVSTVIMTSIGAMECLFEIGFQEDEDALFLPHESTSVEKLSQFRAEISNRRSKYLETNKSLSNTKPNQNESKENEHQTTTQPEPLSQLQSTPGTSSTNNSFLSKLHSLSSMVLQYELKDTKDKVLSVVPLSEIGEKVQRRMREFQQQALKSSQPISEASLQESIFFKELMDWFKNDFFQWVDRPKCLKCKCDTTFLEMSSDTQEKTLEKTDRVEVYKCGNCSARVLFPRINCAVQLMATRRGRCGEWANAFTAVCRALGWEARFISDDTDHAWTEVYFRSEGRWVHCDPCECALDKPLLYEKGWGKKLTYIIAYSCEDVQDVTWRYSANHKEVAARRNKCSELELVQTICNLNRLRQSNLTAKRKKVLAKRTLVELVQLMQPASEQEGDDEGRKSGSLSWRLARQETSASQARVSYVWTPTQQEAEAKMLVINYCTASDTYKRLSGDSMKGWKTGVFRSDSVFRKEEKDWNMAYLCRTEGSNEGNIQWQIDLANCGLVVDRVDLRCSTTTFKSGKVRWLVCAGDKCVRVDKDELKSSEFRGSTSLTLSVCLTGGDGDLAWQHAQIFRQPLDRLEPTFQLSLTLTKTS